MPRAVAKCEYTIFPSLVVLRALVLHVGLARGSARNSRALRLATQARRLRWAGNCDWAGHDGGDGAAVRRLAVGRRWDGLSAWGTTTGSGAACRRRREGRRKGARDARGASGSARGSTRERDGGATRARLGVLLEMSRRVRMADVMFADPS